MQAEEAVGGPPVLKQGLALFEERGDPGIADMCIEGHEHVVDHPEDGLSALSLTKVITLGCMVHLLLCQFSDCDEWLEEVEVIGPAGLHHLHGGQDEVHRIAGIIRVEGLTHEAAFDHLDIQADLLTNCLKSIAKDFVPLHRLSRVLVNYLIKNLIKPLIGAK